MINSYGEVLMKSCQENILHLDYEPNIFANIESLWPKKFFIAVDKIRSKIQYYHHETMRLLHTLHSPNIKNPCKIKGNEKQSLYLCKDNKSNRYCVVKILQDDMSAIDK